MKKFIVCSLVAVVLIMMPACDWFGSKQVTKPRVRLVDVLEKEYFDDMHIMPEAADVVSINVPFLSSEEFMKEASNGKRMFLLLPIVLIICVRQV